jgi:ATP-dependent DNA ligase
MRIKVMPDPKDIFASLYSRQHKKQSIHLHAYFLQLRRLVFQQKKVLDCELWSPILKFNEIMSAIADPKPEHQLQLHVFDIMTEDEWYEGTEQPFMDRVEEYTWWVRRFCGDMLNINVTLPVGFISLPLVVPVEQCLVRDAIELQAFFDLAIENNHEGCMVRGLRSKYKHGRGTLNEGLIFKFKKWVTEDAVIAGFKQGTQKKAILPEARKRDAMGYLKPIHKKGEREFVDVIGSVCVLLRDGTECHVGGGKGDVLGKEGVTWENHKKFLGRWVEIKFQEHGTHLKPRMGSIVRFRPDLDCVSKQSSDSEMMNAKFFGGGF